MDSDRVCAGQGNPPAGRQWECGRGPRVVWTVCKPYWTRSDLVPSVRYHVSDTDPRFRPCEWEGYVWNDWADLHFPISVPVCSDGDLAFWRENFPEDDTGPAVTWTRCQP